MDIDKLFEGMDRVEISGGGQQLGVGRYTVKTKSMRVHDGHWGLRFIAEYTVVESNNEKDPVGSTRSWTCKMGRDNPYAFPEIKSFMIALLGHDPKRNSDPSLNPDLHKQAERAVKIACDSDYARKVGADPDTFSDLLVCVETYVKPPKEPKPDRKEFVKHVWFPTVADV